MKVVYIINNYMLGARLRMTPTDKIVSQKRISKSHTEIVYVFATMKEKEYCDKLLSKAGLIIAEGRRI